MKKQQILDAMKNSIKVIEEHGENAEVGLLLSIFHDFARFQRSDEIFLLKNYINNNIISQNLDAAIAILKILFPNWGYRLCECYLSNDAFIFPDVNDPKHGEKLRKKFGHIDINWEEQTDVALDAENSTLAEALCFSMYKAIKIIVENERLAQ